MSETPQEKKGLFKPEKLIWRTALLNTLLIASAFAIAISINGFLEYLRVASFIEALELKTYDLRSSLRFGDSKRSADPRTMIVKFDDLTLNLYEKEYGTWPWPRKVHADMIDFMTKAGARMLAYDILFTSPQKGLEDSDQALIAAFKRHKNVYFSMNFDNSLALYQQVGQDLTPEILSQLQPLDVQLTSRLSRETPGIVLDKTGFYSNAAMTFNHFRPLLQELMDVKSRIGFINHGRDLDGISRGNPLVFRFIYKKPVHTKYLPISELVDSRTGQKRYLDQHRQAVNAEGIILDSMGKPISVDEISYYPYLGLRMVLDILYPDHEPPLTITERGYLDFGNHHVPLGKNGNYMVAWYNYNYDREQARQFLQIAEPRVFEFQQQMAQNPKLQTQKNRTDVQEALKKIEHAKSIVDNPFLVPAPFPEISASHVLMAMRHEKEGKLTPRDQQLMAFLKGKVIFVGTTALATYDIKSTPLSQMMPGVLLQAHIFDNLLQNRFYIHRAAPQIQVLIMLGLSLLTAIFTFKFRSANMGFLATAALATIYTSITVIMFRDNGLWLNIVMPVLVIVVTMILSFMAKYIRRDRDYKQTYILATTDGMTGLYNHRHFKEQMLAFIDRSKRNNDKFSLVLIDIDFFKKFNDTYGHQMGDEVLRHVAKKLKNSVRSADMVARYGGEEMAVILDRTNEVEALEVAKKLVHLIGAEPYPVAPNEVKQVTISVGVSTFPLHGTVTDQLIEFADKGLYRAKENGRNQVGAQYDKPKPAGSGLSNLGNPFKAKQG